MSLEIVIDNVSKTYMSDRGPVEAVRNVSIDVREGEFVSLVGPSGCGKSTLLHMVAGLHDASEGTITVRGQAVHPGRRDVGIMLQRPVLMAWRTILENVMLPTEIYRLDQVSAKATALSLLKLVGIEKFADRYPWELSGGMQQRASLARLLVTDPDVFLMDEPFGALDEFTKEYLNSELARIHEKFNKACLFVTHHIAEAVYLSDRIAVLKPRPGELLRVIDVPLARPRNLGMKSLPEFFAAVTEVRELLGTVEADDESD